MFKKVTIIGLGTLGGFLCKCISEQDSVKEIIVVDKDIVESKNTFKSIYRYNQVGEYKVNAIKELVDDDVLLTRINDWYFEGITKLPNSDLVIDCRDVVCSRNQEIDIRLYIAEKSLIFDCRKNVVNQCLYEGNYSVNLTKTELYRAAFYATQVIFSNDIHRMISNNLFQRIDLGLVSSVVKKAINISIENKSDIIYDTQNDSCRLHGINQNIKPILEINKKKDVKVYVGTVNQNFNLNTSLEIKEAKTEYFLIPKQTKSFEVISQLNNIVNKQPGIKNFFVTVTKVNGEECVELIEESGAA